MKIVSAALVMSIFEMWVSLVEPMISELIQDNAEIVFIPEQVQAWLKHCVPSDVIDLGTLAFGDGTTWSSILERFPSGIIEDVIRPIRHGMTKTP